ncbi:YcaO-like family protein [Streptomyces sp. PT12]|uniref:YcaO-like family protein n=1 Tax=Streptomyces sp. PT12 TaxID=1510197 RepID=UPI0015EECC84|nr:YcaO-like family protein [Streptomyces sp. PT12]
MIATAVPDEPQRWVWGRSFGRGELILVPEAMAFYGTGHHPVTGHGVAYETSSGCALGGSVEEAIPHGLLEVAERDAFLLTWYGRLPVPETDLSTAADRRVGLLAAAITAEKGYRPRAFDMTMEQGIPAVLALALAPERAGDGEPALPCAAAAHPDPETALRSALYEVGPGVPHVRRRWAEPGAAERVRRMLADPFEVRMLTGRVLLHAAPEAAARLGFLTGAAPSRRVADVGRRERGGFAADDLRDNVHEAVARYAASGLVGLVVIVGLVVDQTAAEHRAGGLRCVKVLISGTLPMTFGHRNRRVTGLPRLHRVPHLLGLRERPLTDAEINPHPHPFP